LTLAIPIFKEDNIMKKDIPEIHYTEVADRVYQVLATGRYRLIKDRFYVHATQMLTLAQVSKDMKSENMVVVVDTKLTVIDTNIVPCDHCGTPINVEKSLHNCCTDVCYDRYLDTK
jgi:hypothetical protein